MLCLMYIRGNMCTFSETDKYYGNGDLLDSWLAHHSKMQLSIHHKKYGFFLHTLFILDPRIKKDMLY